VGTAPPQFANPTTKQQKYHFTLYATPDGSPLPTSIPDDSADQRHMAEPESMASQRMMLRSYIEWNGPTTGTVLFMMSSISVRGTSCRELAQ
jgi:hypothetical protein